MARLQDLGRILPFSEASQKLGHLSLFLCSAFPQDALIPLSPAVTQRTLQVSLRPAFLPEKSALQAPGPDSDF